MYKSLQIAGFVLLMMCGPALAQNTPARAPTASVQVQAMPAINGKANFDPVKATDAYLWRINGSERLRSDTYFEGRYWLMLVRVLYAILVAAGLLWLRVSSAMRDLAERVTRKRIWQTSLYAVQYIAVMTVLSFPLTFYQNYAREHIFDLSNQSFLDWLADFGLGTALNIILGSILLTILYWVVRKAKQAWWLWGAGVAILYLVFAIAITPNLLGLYVHFSPLPDGQMKSDIQELARGNGLDAKNISVITVSDRTNRIGAGIIGFGKNANIVVYDTLLKEGSEREIKMAIAQEIGHAVMNHAMNGLVLFSLLIFAGFAFAHYSFLLLADLFGGSWDVRRLDDPAGLPILIAAGTVFFLLASPLTNWIGRNQGKEADLFALNAAREPDALATLILKQSAFVKLEPGELEEDLFYNRPSGRSRIGTAMRWKDAHLTDGDIASGPTSPQ